MALLGDPEGLQFGTQNGTHFRSLQLPNYQRFYSGKIPKPCPHLPAKRYDRDISFSRIPAPPPGAPRGRRPTPANISIEMLGSWLGAFVGDSVGACDGAFVGVNVGDGVGGNVGVCVGVVEGVFVGDWLGALVGCLVG